MRVLLSGASGFIARELTAALATQGHEVHALVRSRPEAGEVGIDLASGTLDTSKFDKAGLSRIDAVVNLAGEPITLSPWGPKKRKAIRDSRIETTAILANELAKTKSGPATFISASAIGYYGSRGDEILVEGSRPGTGFLAEVCREWELAAKPARDAGVRVVNLRTGIVLGPHGGFLGQVIPIFKAGLGARLGSGRQWMSWISMADEVGAIIHALKHDDIDGPVNATAPVPVRNSEMTTALAAALDRPALLKVPGLVLELALGPSTARDLALGSQRVLPERLQAHGYNFAHAELGEALSAALDQTSHLPIKRH